MSKIAERVYEVLKENFPNNIIQKEYFIKYKNKKLFFDFYIKDLGVLIEVQGQQHTQFVEHFHSNKQGFDAQKYRDRLKAEFVLANPKYCLVRFNYNERITTDLVLAKIFNALNEGFYE